MNELTISLDAKASKPLYEQIYGYIKKEIESGGLPFEERLPSTRMLAKHLQVSRSTVELAYEQLLSEGYIEAVPYRGILCASWMVWYVWKDRRRQKRYVRQRKKSGMYMIFLLMVSR